MTAEFFLSKNVWNGERRLSHLPHDKAQGRHFKYVSHFSFSKIIVVVIIIILIIVILCKFKVIHHVLHRQCWLRQADVIMHSKAAACDRQFACNPAKRKLQLSCIWSKGLVLLLWGFTIQKGTDFIKCARGRVKATTWHPSKRQLY